MPISDLSKSTPVGAMPVTALSLRIAFATCALAVACLLPSTDASAQQAAGGAAQQAPQKGVQTRVPPKRRTGKEGSDEAKIDADQARELYIRRKLRLEQIQEEQQELAKDQRTLATNRARMKARLIETARALRLSEKRLSEIEDRLAEVRAKAKDEHQRLDDKASQMSALFVLMQSMSRAAAARHDHAQPGRAENDPQRHGPCSLLR